MHSASAASGAAAVASPTSSPSALPVAAAVDKADKKRKKEQTGLLAKLRNYKDVAIRTRDTLENVQNQIAEWNVLLMKIEGYAIQHGCTDTQPLVMLCYVIMLLSLHSCAVCCAPLFVCCCCSLYRWRAPATTEKFLFLLIGVFFVFVLIPFRFIFPFIGNAATGHRHTCRDWLLRSAQQCMLSCCCLLLTVAATMCFLLLLLLCCCALLSQCWTFSPRNGSVRPPLIACWRPHHCRNTCRM